MDTKAMVYDYHERTKHHPNRYAASLGYMDWATQPDPFRHYEGAQLIKLPLIDENDSPTYAELFQTDRTAQPLTRESLSQLLQYSLGLSAWKSIGNDSWALRCNASSGNLHPTESTVILPPIEGISEQSIVAHYAPKEHVLEILAAFSTSFWETLPKGSLFIGLSSVLWREAWKYGERAFRYTQLDAGHAQHAVEISARLWAWQTDRIDTIRCSELDRLLGLDQSERYIHEEKEISDMLLFISPVKATQIDFSALLNDLPETYKGNANQLSHAHHHWEAVELIERATAADTISQTSNTATQTRDIICEQNAKSLILKRRSTQAMDFGRTQITKSDLLQLLASVKAPLQPGDNSADLLIFVHDVKAIDSGLYLYIRNNAHLPRLKHLSRNDFAWEEVEPDLYLLEAGDFKSQAKFISCSQDIAGDSAFSLGMLCEFEPQIEAFGSRRYKELYWECGAIGQQLYLEATSLSLNATGIGCYLDDVMHRLLGLKNREFQVLYHFTIGRAIIDLRLTTLPPYNK